MCTASVRYVGQHRDYYDVLNISLALRTFHTLSSLLRLPHSAQICVTYTLRPRVTFQCNSDHFACSCAEILVYYCTYVGP